jgi:site-specific DNA-cytosine methylase
MYCAPGSLARTLVLAAEAPELRKEREVVSGKTLPSAFAYYDQASSSWRTWQPSGAEDLAGYSGDLAACGYNANWTSLRASDVGAAHRRERVFILAYRQDSEATDILAAAYARGQRWQRWAASSQTSSWWSSGRPIRFGDLGMAVTGDRRRPALQASSVSEIAWGRYGAAIRRWEVITGRQAPYPVERGTHGQPRLAAVFSEWLMGLPKGFVTELDLPYSAQHRVLGNGYGKGSRVSQWP